MVDDSKVSVCLLFLVNFNSFFRDNFWISVVGNQDLIVMFFVIYWIIRCIFFLIDIFM